MEVARGRRGVLLFPSGFGGGGLMDAVDMRQGNIMIGRYCFDLGGVCLIFFPHL